MANHFIFGAVNTITSLYEPVQIATKCNKYACPECKNDVIFAKGSIRRPYFAHKKDTNCGYYQGGGGESFIHKEAKTRLKWYLQNKEIVIRIPCNSCHIKHHTVIQKYDSEKDTIVLEHRYDNCHSADIAYLHGTTMDIFEIIFTHSTDSRPEPWYEIEALDVLKLQTDTNRCYLDCVRYRQCDACKEHIEITRIKNEYAEKERQKIENDELLRRQKIENDELLRRQKRQNDELLRRQKIDELAAIELEKHQKLEDAFDAHRRYLNSECGCGIEHKNICNCKLPNVITLKNNNEIWCNNCNKWKCRC